MSHPVKVRHAVLMRGVAVVTVECTYHGKKPRLSLAPGVRISKEISMTRLPADIQIVSGDQAIEPSEGRAFWISTATIDPFHLVTEGPLY